MSKRSWIIFLIIVVGLFAGLVLWSKSNSSQVDVSNIDPREVQTASEANGDIGDHVAGNPSSDIILIEYGDFQCPPCASAEPTIKSLLDNYGDRMQFIFRNFPIVDSHPNAKAAAATAEAAGFQGKYWEMHDKIYANQSEWSSANVGQRNDIFKRYATELGLDIERFSNDIGSSSITRKINFDRALAVKDGADATPTFLLNGEKKAVNELEDAIKAKLGE